MTVGMATVVITKRKKRARPSARNNEACSEKNGKRSVTMGNAINRLSAKTRLIANAKTVITTTIKSARLIGRTNNETIAPIRNKVHPMRNKYCVTLMPVCSILHYDENNLHLKCQKNIEHYYDNRKCNVHLYFA